MLVGFTRSSRRGHTYHQRIRHLPAEPTDPASLILLAYLARAGATVVMDLVATTVMDLGRLRGALLSTRTTAVALYYGPKHAQTTTVCVLTYESTSYRSRLPPTCHDPGLQPVMVSAFNLSLSRPSTCHRLGLRPVTVSASNLSRSRLPICHGLAFDLSRSRPSTCHGLGLRPVTVLAFDLSRYRPRAWHRLGLRPVTVSASDGHGLGF